MTRNEKRFARCGFTLVELMVAMVVLAIMISIIYSSFARASAAAMKMESFMDLNHVSRFIVSRMSDDLASASTLPKNRNGFFLGEMLEAQGDARLDKLSFTGYGRRLVTPGVSSDQAVITWYAVKKPENELYTLMRSENFNTFAEQDEEDLARTSFDITNQLVSFKVSYWRQDQLDNEWKDEYDSTKNRGTPMILSVKFTLQDNKGNHISRSTIIPVGERL